MRKILIGAIAFALTSPAAAVDLLGVYELASTNDPQIRAAELRLESAAFGEAIARASLLPSINSTVRKTIGENTIEIDGDIIDDDVFNDDEVFRIDLTQSIYDDANWARLNRARSVIAQADAQYNIAWQDFLLRVSQRYFDILTAIDAVQFAKAEELALQRQFEQAEQRFEVGLSAVTDFLEARAAWDGARARVIVAVNSLEDAREALRELTGETFESYKPLAEELPLEPPEPALPEQWVTRALASSPELEASRQGLNVADSDVRVANADYLPTLDLTAGYSINTNNEFQLRDDFQRVIRTTEFENTGWSLGLQLNIPIFQGLGVRSRARQAAVDQRVAVEDLEFEQRTVVRNTENAYRAVIAGIREVEALNQALISAESALEATNAGFEVGTRTIVDVLLAEQRFFQAQRDFSQARHQFIVDNLSLERAVGTLAPEDLEQANRRLSGPERSVNPEL